MKLGTRLVSGDTIGDVCVWERTEKVHSCIQIDNQSFQRRARARAHDGSISAIGFYGDWILTGGSDGKIKLWSYTVELNLVEEVSLKGRLPLDIEVAQLPGSQGIDAKSRSTQILL